MHFYLFFVAGYYIYYEASGGKTGDQAQIESKTISTGTKELTFYYNMYGSRMGSLRAFVKTASGTFIIWQKSGNHLCSLVFHLCSLVFNLCSLVFHLCSLVFHLCSFVFYLCSFVFICVHLCSTCVHLCSFVFICVHLCSFVFHLCSFVFHLFGVLD